MIEGSVVIFNACELQTGLDNNNHDDDGNKQLSKLIRFMICESCFWCASCISSKSISIAKCSNCCNNKIEWMPIPKVDLDKLTCISKEGDSVAYY
jgi:hypothetical protein